MLCANVNKRQRGRCSIHGIVRKGKKFDAGWLRITADRLCDREYELRNDKAFLLKVVSRCLPYIGYLRSLNAITCINKAAE